MLISLYKRLSNHAQYGILQRKYSHILWYIRFFIKMSKCSQVTCSQADMQTDTARLAKTVAALYSHTFSVQSTHTPQTRIRTRHENYNYRCI